MDHLVTGHDARMLARRWRRMDERAPRPTSQRPGGARVEREPPSQGETPGHLGPYETTYEITRGYTSDRRILTR